ncbi:zinc-dependent metalloprotease [Mucilaginibacter sp. L3T2-6]|uniref:zinc-dependent metalloprotease n=1 Tax=Mucilaginibacter sp. L3T2-6 TaxID=3062491 RepID=UPI002676B3CE|nr:zinc-dependent metalloprotease [Mucilaginibacter sp. L3T2-6]MDO3641609.1 zinc-dependent metalloprotease [Mucilaginibacter sp. L3T2-6]MDV6214103.1 zinc-dependent metalloprotease [Mucilaginibacter sp. L3T2-6]
MKKIYLLILLSVNLLTVATAQKSAGISTATKGLTPYKGYFNFYWDENTGRILLEVDKLNTEFLYVNSLPAGVGSNDLGLDRGQIGDSRIVKFVRSGPKILLVQPNYSYRAISNNPDERKSVEEAFAQSVIWGFKAEAIEGNKALIDFTPFLLRDAHHLAEKLSGQGSYSLDESRSAVYLDNTKDFPDNSEFEATITIAGPGRGSEISSVTPDPNAVTVRMHHSFIRLPDNNYKIRKFDPRSGFYDVDYMDYATPIDQPIVKRLLSRHRLQKKDPTAAMSEAVKPIVYYVDRGAPEPVRTALMEGASWWNQAFEAAGYKNAFQVKLLPEDADPMDIRYNIIQWVHRSTRGWSYGASINDPRTGEIIKGQVSLGSLRDRQDFLIAEGLVQPYEDGKPVSDKMMKMAIARLHQLAAHEVGHTLGLQHNFAASVNNRASVMDYPPPVFTLAQDGTVDLSSAYTTEIGSWDKRAILYGYQDFPAGADEDKALKEILTETLKQGQLFITDEDARPAGGAHPLAHLWDNGKNAADELNRLLDIRRKILNNFSEKSIRQDAPMATLEEVLVPVYLMHRYQVEAASKMLGGIYYTYAIKNDGQPTTRFIPAAEQWKAFNALMQTISPATLALPEKLIEKIPPRPDGYPRTRELFKSRTGLTFDPMAAAEGAAGTTLQFMLHPERAARLVEYHSRDNTQPGLIAIEDKLIAQTWKAPQQNGYNGELQRLVNNLTLKQLLTLAADSHAVESVRGITMMEINGLKTWMQGAVKNAQTNQKANLVFGLSQIAAFEKNPGQFKPAEPVGMPDGSPIGESD